jgi:tetraprenyl-beta-curcumene synthase
VGLFGLSRERRACTRLAEARTLLSVGAVYWLLIHRQVRRELRGWDERARLIPDTRLRQQALDKLSGERLNPEAAALFAVLAPARQRARVVSLIVAYQVLYDYLDGVNELPGLDDLADGLRMHASLTEALLPEWALSDPYLSHPELDDGGYVHDLCRVCRRLVGELPHLAQASETILRATGRCGEAQSHNHAALRRGRGRLIDWSRAQGSARHGYLWWEMAAGGISCLNIHALIASAADPRSGGEYAARVDAAYFPSVCAISALLDSLADYHLDSGTGNHSFVAHYRDPDQAASRLVAIAGEARKLGRSLHNRGRHAVILAGIVAYYISSPSVRHGFPAPAARRLRGSIGPVGACMYGVMRLRRRHHDLTLRGDGRGRFSRALAARGWAGRATP